MEQQNTGSNVGDLLLLLGTHALVGIAGHDIGKAKNEQMVNKLNTQVQLLRQECDGLRQTVNRLLQSNSAFRTENVVLKDLLRQQPSTPQTEDISKTLKRIESRLTELLSSEFERGGDGQNPERN